MASILTNKYKLLNAKKILDIFSSTTDNIYCFVGKVSDWISEPTVDPIVDSLGSDITNWDDLIYAKKVSTSNVTLAIPANEWTAGVTFDPYEHDVDMSSKNWYITDRASGRVYKCISNNSNEVSVGAPTGEDVDAVEITSDNYHWKYMYTADNVNTFTTTDTNFQWHPIKELLLDDNTKQWDVQENAVKGGIHHIKSTKETPSFDPTIYTVGHSVTVVSNSGGSGFVGEIANHIGTNKQYVNITNPGSGYTKVDKVLVNSLEVTHEVDAVQVPSLKAIISPISGHGFNAAREFDTSALLVTCEFEENEPPMGSNHANDTYNDYRKVGLVLNPIVSWGDYDIITTGGSSISSGTRYLDSSADQRIQIKWQNVDGDTQSGYFPDDAVVWQGAVSIEDATARGYVVSKNSTLKHIYVVTTDGGFISGSDIHSSTGTLANANINSITNSTTPVSSTILYPLKRYSGDIIYIDHRAKIARTNSTIKETVRIVIQF